MKIYVENLLPRIKEFSQSLDKKEVFIDTPWILIDEDHNQQKYIFKRNGDLIMSFNGEVNIGKWEYLSEAKSILIDRVRDKILLNQYFIHSAVMILKLDGPKQTNFILANELIIPDYKVDDFIKNLYYTKKNVDLIKLKDGRVLEVIENIQSSAVTKDVTIEGENIKDGIFESGDENRKYEIKESRITRILVDIRYQTKFCDLIVEQQQYGIKYGDRVFIDNQQAQNGKYKIGFLEYLYVIDGKVCSKKLYKEVQGK